MNQQDYGGGGGGGSYDRGRGRGRGQGNFQRGNYQNQQGRGNFNPRGGDGGNRVIRQDNPGGGGGGGGFRGRGGGYHGQNQGPNPRDLPMPESESHQQLCRQAMGGGLEGSAVELVSNFFKINSSIKEGVLVYQYSITIKRAEAGSGAEAEEAGEGGGEQQPQQQQQGQGQAPYFRSAFEAFLKKASPEIIEQFIARNGDVFGRDREEEGGEGAPATRFGVIHDGVQSLYSTARLQLELLPEVQEITLAQGRSNRLAISLAFISTIDLGQVERFYENKQQESGSGKQATTTTPKCPTEVSARVLPVYEQLVRSLVQSGGSFTAHQRNFYDLATPRGRRPLRCNRAFDSVAGFSASVRLTEIGLALNLHHKSAAVLSANLATLEQLVGCFLKVEYLDNLSPSQIRRASKLVGGLKVKTTYGRREVTYTVDGISFERADQYKFSVDGVETTVQQYYQDRFGITVDALPLVRTRTDIHRGGGGGPREGPGRREKVHLPMEVCELLPDQFLVEQRQPQDVQTELLGAACLEPNVYFTKVVDFVRRIKAIDPLLLAHFGVELSVKPVKLQARRLPLPTILDGSQNLRGRNQGQAANRWKGFYQPGTVPAKWAVFCYDDFVTEEKIREFVRSFKAEAGKKGLVFPMEQAVVKMKMEQLGGLKGMFDKIRERNVQFVLLVIPKDHLTLDADDLYAVSKYWDMENDQLTTQCVKGENVMNTPKGYFDNLLDKVNTKLNGINTIVDPAYLRLHVPQLKMEETMLVGVDVNHPGELDRGGARISVAAAVASYDVNATRYTCSMRIQLKERLETVVQMEEMMAALLAQYRRHNGLKLPTNVVVFRDGVGDGLMREIQRVELAAIETALEKVSSKQKINLACVVVQKRHTVRFGLTEANTAGRRPTYNAASGTVVDSYIVEPTVDGMLLNSHYSQLGTSRPSKYTVLRDDFHLKPDQLERLCFFACHACARSREPMSIPTPIKYADLLAFRAKIQINAWQVLFNQHSGGGGGAHQTEQHQEFVERLSRKVQVDERSASKMFYV